MAVINCIVDERTPFGLKVNVIKKSLPTSFQRQRNLSSCIFYTLLLKPFFLNEGNFAQAWNKLAWD